MLCCGSIDILLDPGLNKTIEEIQICVAEGPPARVPGMLHVRPTPHPLHLFYIANNCALLVDVRFVRYLLFHNLPRHQIDISQQPPNLPEGRAQVVIDHV